MDHTGTTCRKRVLVVDDHDISRHYVTAALSQSGCTVKQATGVSDALEIILDWYPQTVFVDWNLPGGTGESVVQQARMRWPACRWLPRFILLTGESRDALPEAAFRCGFDAVLEKPCPAAELTAQARCQGNSIAESRPDEHSEIHRLFREELHANLSRLARQLSDRRLADAAAVAHQLIAASAICGEAQLESALRSLHAACQAEPDPCAVAGAWCLFSRAASDCLEGVTAQN